MLELLLGVEKKAKVQKDTLKTECFELDNSSFLGFYQNNRLIGQLCMEGPVKIQYPENSRFRIEPIAFHGTFRTPSFYD